MEHRLSEYDHHAGANGWKSRTARGFRADEKVLGEATQGAWRVLIQRNDGLIYSGFSAIVGFVDHDHLSLVLGGCFPYIALSFARFRSDDYFPFTGRWIFAEMNLHACDNNILDSDQAADAGARIDSSACRYARW
jgi:hypothetical protein